MSKKIHFTGIGGIGVSALAQYYLEKGYQITGSDLEESETTNFLSEKGIEVFIGPQKGKGIDKNTKMLIHSPAVSYDNPDIKKAKKLDIKVLSYPEALGQLTRKYFSICVSGTHGKSTTSSMLSSILQEAGLDPTVILGTKLKRFGNTNFKKGKSKYLILEADEYADSFLNYNPDIIVLTNIEKDHLDYFKNLEGILSSFKKYISNLKKTGEIVANGEDKNIKKVLKGKDFKNSQNIKKETKKKIKESLQIPGEHNLLNAFSCFKTAEILDIDKKETLRGIKNYKGAWRRFEEERYKINGEEKTIIFDYAHHPTELEATCKAAREKYKNKKIKLIFQPHQHQRTKILFDDFVEKIKRVGEKKIVDKILMTNIYDVAGREDKKTKKVSSKELVEEIGLDNIGFLPKNQYQKDLINSKEEVILIMGAGDIYKKYKKILNLKG